MKSRKYKVAESVFEIILEEPWNFMDYSDVVLERIRRAAAGEPGLEILPTRAGDKEPHRTLVQLRSELPENFDPRRDLDLSQYEPFRYEGDAEPVFSLTVKAGLEGLPDIGRKLMRVDVQMPYYTIYDKDGAPSITLDEHPDTGVPSATLCMDSSFRSGSLFPHEGIRPSSLVFEMSTALMMMFTYNLSSKGTVLMHASVVRHKGKANIFLGKSGTGKSTHSHLWLEHVEGCDLLNDDNPVISIAPDGTPIVYGTPWSGKTPCYRNVSAPVRAIVRLEQKSENIITRKEGFQAYTDIIGSISSIRWNRPVMDGINDTAEKLVLGARIFTLGCRPDREAAMVCMEAVES